MVLEVGRPGNIAPGMVAGNPALAGVQKQGGHMLLLELRLGLVHKVLARLRVQLLVEVGSISPSQGNAKFAMDFHPLGLRSAPSATTTGSRVTSKGVLQGIYFCFGYNFFNKYPLFHISYLILSY